MGYYNNKSNKYDGHSNPFFVWRNKDYPYGIDFEDKIELWKKEALEKNRTIEAKEHTVKDTKDKKILGNEARKIVQAKKNRGGN